MLPWHQNNLKAESIFLVSKFAFFLMIGIDCKEKTPTRYALDVDAQKLLWEKSAKVVGLFD